ncbi:hypothetical protein DAPPUDRAFT_305472 [Daphnia pulex]|uniref:Uncharacterized protein n=1 Tax=Daphnia pulex TaxID=6669 RepID=E9FWW5_DAPPU|nr:hypothetical protein DAPPUDRAFT_305472 [Daphnia pulex]|eukprot:EFX88364.1 hypothetical protein DAPPUDRAFT_305472 [Daphnia pulex]
MFKTIALLVIFGCAFAAPTPRVEKRHPAQFRSDNHNKLIPGNAIKELESSLDGIDSIFKHPFGKIGSNKKFGFLAEDNTKDFFPTTDAEDFEVATRPTRQDSREVLGVAQARDPFVGTEEAAARAIDSPLFFNTFDHAHMVTGYAERRRDRPMLFRSIRPDFPFSDISRRRQRVNN